MFNSIHPGSRMPIFEKDASPGYWLPTPLAAGPFSGLQGGAIAGLLTAEVETLAAPRRWGTAISVSVAFLKPTPMTRLRTTVSALREGGRVSFVDNTLFAADDAEPCATARVTLINERAVEAPAIADARPEAIDPTRYPLRKIASFHGKPWMMDAMDARSGDGVAWFRQHTPTLADAPANGLSSILGPADWAHGIARPMQNVLADPNPNLTVHLLRPAETDWIGIRPHVSWQTARGLGVGGGTILDVRGEIGHVSMAVALVPFPKQAAAPAKPERENV
jgi:Thioesterase-like superfamily